MPLSGDLQNISIGALRPTSIELLSGRLNPPKILPTADGKLRDWRGLAHFIGLNVTNTDQIRSSNNPTECLIRGWHNGTIKELQNFLETHDRFDVLDDAQSLIEKDIEVYLNQSSQVNLRVPELARNKSDSVVLTSHDVHRAGEGLPPQNYDAFLLYADEDADFAEKIVQNLEQENSMMICRRDHLVGGVSFEHEAVAKLIDERCHRLLVVFSPAFLQSSFNKFVVTFAQALGIDREERKVIPIIYKECLLPLVLRYTYAPKFYLDSSCLFWESLRNSIPVVFLTEHATDRRSPRIPQLESPPSICELESAVSVSVVNEHAKSHDEVTASVRIDTENLHRISPSLPSEKVNPIKKLFRKTNKKKKIAQMAV